MPDWSKSALVFAGQGSQTVGMVADVAAAYPLADGRKDGALERSSL